MRYQTKLACISHMGLVRKNNEDNFILDQEYMDAVNTGTGGIISDTIEPDDRPTLVGVFDGMGGEECGETAAWLAAQAASEHKLTGRDADDLNRILRHANHRICQYAYDNSILSTGTTANLMILGKDGISAANLGDSRIYRITPAGIQQLSEDHVMPTMSGRKAPLLQYLGIPEEEMRLEPHIVTCPVADGDVFLLCTDGLTDMVSPKGIAEVVDEQVFSAPDDADALPRAAEALLKRALDAGGHDNITLVICRVSVAQTGLKRLLGRLQPH